MIDIWVKLIANQFEVALNTTIAVLGLGGREAPVSVHVDPVVAAIPVQADALAANPMDEPTQATVRLEEPLAAVVPEAAAETLREPAQISDSNPGEIRRYQTESQTGSAQAQAAIIPGIISFLESANRGATVREIAERLEMDKRSILPLLKTLVKERRIDELLGRYCVLKS